MDHSSDRIPCPDREPQRSFVHRITPSECQRLQAANYHKCSACPRARIHQAPLEFRGLLAPQLRRAG